MTTENRTQYSSVSKKDGTYKKPPKRKYLESTRLKPGERLDGYIEEEIINAAISEAATYIAARYLNPNTLILTNLRGAQYFEEKIRDCLRSEDQSVFNPHRIRISRASTTTTATFNADINAQVEQWIEPDSLEGKSTVVILEDITDENLTIKHIIERLLKINPNLEVKVITLFDKQNPHKDESLQQCIEFAGLYVQYLYLVGCGLDEGKNRFRNEQSVYVYQNREQDLLKPKKTTLTSEEIKAKLAVAHPRFYSKLATTLKGS